MDENALLAEQNHRLERTILQSQPRRDFYSLPYPYTQPYPYPYPYPYQAFAAPDPGPGLTLPPRGPGAEGYGPYGGYDYNEDGADPLWAREQERIRQADLLQRQRQRAGRAEYGGGMSPGFRRAREADTAGGGGGRLFGPGYGY